MIRIMKWSWDPIQRPIPGKFRYDLAFIGAAGIDPITKEIYTVSIETAACKQAAMHNSVKNVLLIDSSKFGQRGFCYFASSDEFDSIISDDSLPNQLIISIIYGSNRVDKSCLHQIKRVSFEGNFEGHPL